MQVDVLKDPNGAECIRCGKCGSICPESAIKLETLFQIKKIVNKPDEFRIDRNT